MSGPFLVILLVGCVFWCFGVFLMLFSRFQNWRLKKKDALLDELLLLLGVGLLVIFIPLILIVFSTEQANMITAGSLAFLGFGYLAYCGLRLYRHLDKDAPFRSFCLLFCPGFLLSLPVTVAIPIGFLIDNDLLGVLWGSAAASAVPWNFFFLPIFELLDTLSWYTDIFQFAAIHKYFPKQCYADEGYKIYLTLPLLYASCIGAHINGMFLFRARRRRRERQVKNDTVEQP